MVHHLWPSQLPGGYVGVDVFFAISGFLITSLLLRELESTGRLSLSAFWARRARRILPAAMTTLAFCTVATVVLVPMTAWDRTFAELRASTAYVENWHLSSAAVDYFAAADEPTHVRHFWSLSVEEQFYVVWPLLLMLLIAVTRHLGAPARRRCLAGGLAALAAASLAYSATATASNPAATYFVTPARAWEFAAGGLLALLPAASGSRARSAAVSWAGLAAIAVAALAYTPETPFPGLAALLPVLGACAVIRAGSPAHRWAPTPVLRLRPAQYLGDVSYAVYLWHWPLLLLAPFALDRAVDDRAAVALLVVTLAVAAASKVLVEDPVRSGTFLTSRRPRCTLCLAAAATAALLAATVLGTRYVEAEKAHAAKTSEAFVKAHARCLGAAVRDDRHPCRDRRLRLKVVPTPLEAAKVVPPCDIVFHLEDKKVCEFGVPADEATTQIALVGDSHAEHWRPALQAVARARGWHGIHAGHASCPLSRAVRNIPEPNRSHCTKWREAVIRWLRSHPEVTIVFVSAIAGGTGAVPQRGKTRFETEVEGYRRAWRDLPPSVARVVVIRDTPRVHGDTDVCVEQAMNARRPAGPACAVTRGRALSRDAAVVAAESSATDRAAAVDLTRFFCDARTCYPVVGGVLVYHDQNHMTPLFAKTLGPYLRRAVDVLLRRGSQSRLPYSPKPSASWP